ncbi:MAG: hypothetical protein R6V57_16035 [Vicinamibacterales bacterium]
MAPLPQPSPAPFDTSARFTRLGCAAIGVSVALRLAAALYLGNSVDPMPGIYDQVSYHTLAIRVLDGHGFSFGTDWWPATAAGQPTAHWSFLYVLLLAAIYGVGGPEPLLARVIQAVAVGLLHPLLTYRVTARMFGARVGLVSAAVVAGYAYFVYYAAALLTESLYMVAILWSVDRAIALADARGQPVRRARWLWLQLGLALAAAVLLRQVVLVVVPVILLWAWRQSAGGGETRGSGASGRRQAAAGVLSAVLVVAAAILPWTARNYQAFGRFVLLNTNAGFAFYWGNHPIHGTRFVPILPDGMYAALIPDDLRELDEARVERELMERGLRFVAADPWRFLRLSAGRLEEYLKFWPSPNSGHVSNFARVVSFGVCLPFMVGGMILARSRALVLGGKGHPEPHPAVRLLLGVAGVYTLVHLASWTLVRYRLPVDAVLMPFAALSMAWLRDQVRDRARAASQKRATT